MNEWLIHGFWLGLGIALAGLGVVLVIVLIGLIGLIIYVLKSDRFES